MSQSSRYMQITGMFISQAMKFVKKSVANSGVERRVTKKYIPEISLA